MKIIAFDLGTGGVKASLYDKSLQTLSKSFIEYKTYFPAPDRHEQLPSDWWNGVIQSIKSLLEYSGVDPSEIACLSLSGHSLVTVPIDKDGNCLMNDVPIWSDTRAQKECEAFFNTISKETWYQTTGNGFPPAHYSIFKLMWLKKHHPDVFNRIDKVLGSKDYINFRLTGFKAMDYSYASGTGAYELITGKMSEEFLNAAGLPASIFPDIVPSHTILGNLTKEAATATGLSTKTLVACGGVDNACMALGAVGTTEGQAYISLGTSSWIPVNSSTPILDSIKKPYVFAHIEEGMFTSAFSIFSGGNSFRWLRDTIYPETLSMPDPYTELCDQAKNSVPGSHGIIFNPSLAGGTSQDKSPNIRGAYIGLGLETIREDIIRATLEGITFNLKCSYDFMREKISLADKLLVCGGGSKSPFWMQLFADIFHIEIQKTNIDQDAASLGAAAIAARAIGLWNDYSQIPNLHMVEKQYYPNAESTEVYDKQYKIFKHVSNILSDLGDYMHNAF